MFLENKIIIALQKVFNSKFKSNDELIYIRAPGRVNLIGEHTDYNNGFVFPAAVNLEIYGIACKRDDSVIQVYSEDFQELKKFDTSLEIKKEDSWLDYIKGVIEELKEIVEIKYGSDIACTSTLPVDSGLSSSAAFEFANALLFSDINSIEISREDLALLCQRAENNYIGVNCGIMDQFAVGLGEEDSALFLDTMKMEYELVNLRLSGHKMIIGNTGKPRTLADSAYNTRRKECETAVSILKNNNDKIGSLRDVDIEMLRKNKDLFEENIYKRALHVVEENKRVLDSVAFLKEKDLKNFGKLMIRSHESLRDLYEVSCRELDVMVEEALSIDGVLGSRMTGAGFGGCTISLIEENSVVAFVDKVGRNYKKETGLEPEFYVVDAVNGVEIIRKGE